MNTSGYYQMTSGKRINSTDSRLTNY